MREAAEELNCTLYRENDSPIVPRGKKIISIFWLIRRDSWDEDVQLVRKKPFLANYLYNRKNELNYNSQRFEQNTGCATFRRIYI